MWIYVVRAWIRSCYCAIGGHNRFIHVADDFELRCMALGLDDWVWNEAWVYSGLDKPNPKETVAGRSDWPFRLGHRKYDRCRARVMACLVSYANVIDV